MEKEEIINLMLKHSCHIHYDGCNGVLQDSFEEIAEEIINQTYRNPSTLLEQAREEAYKKALELWKDGDEINQWGHQIRDEVEEIIDGIINQLNELQNK